MCRPSGGWPCSAMTSPGSWVRGCGHVHPALQLVVVEVVEQVDRAQVGERDGRQLGRIRPARPSRPREVLVDQRDGHRALADRARHALDRARAHVAGDEHARDARLEHVGVARAAASRRPFASGPARMKPRSSRATTPSSQSVRGAAPMNTKQASTSSTRSPSASRMRSRRRRPSSPSAAIACAPVRTSMFVDRGDLLDEVVGHRLRQRVAAHEHRHPRGVAAEVDGRLPGRVGAADDDDVLVGARARLGHRRAVVDARRR